MEVSGDDYLEKLKKKYGYLDGDILIIDLSRNQINQGNSNKNFASNESNSKAMNTNLGLSLAGNKDRSIYSVFVCGIHPQGLAGKDGRIKIGDQLIEANGVQLLERCHLNAGVILQQLPGCHIKLVVLRKSDAIKNMAVRPITNFSNNDYFTNLDVQKFTFGQNIRCDILEKFKKDIKKIVLKKDSKDLGIVISEGNHSDLGKGIFVSEIQGSIAEKSGLKVGDMLISVNQIQLISIDYDIALNLLKSMDGLIILNVIQTTNNEKMLSNINEIENNQIKLVSFIIVKDEKENVSYLKQVSFSNLENISEEIKKELSYNKKNLCTDHKLEILGKCSEEICLKNIDDVKCLEKNIFLFESDNAENLTADLHESNVSSNEKCTNSSICTSVKMHNIMNNLSGKNETNLELENDKNVVNDQVDEIDLINNKETFLESNEDLLDNSKNNISNERLLDSINREDLTKNQNELLIETTNQENDKKSLNEEIQISSTDLTEKNEDESRNKNENKNENSNFDSSELIDKESAYKEYQQEDSLDLKSSQIYAGSETWIELTKKKNQVLGIYLIDTSIDNEKYVAIFEINPNGIVAQDKRLNIGDIIIQVNDISLKGLDSKTATDYLNCTNGIVKLLVYRELICVSKKNQVESIENDETISTKLLVIHPLRKKFLDESNYEFNTNHKIIDNKLYKLFDVELQKKTGKGLGLNICNRISNDKIPNCFINDILPNSIAYSSGKFKKGDYLLSINNQDVTKFSFNSTLKILKFHQGIISFKLARLLPGKVINVESNEAIQSHKIEYSKEFIEFNKKLNIKSDQQVENNINCNSSLLNGTYNELDKFVEYPTMKNWVKIEKRKHNQNELNKNSNLNEARNSFETTQREISKSSISLKISKKIIKIHKDLMDMFLS